MKFDTTDIVGKKFGLLTVKTYSRKVKSEKYKHFKHYYECICDCGATTEKQRSNLITNHTTSCGCLKKRRGVKNPCWDGHGEISGRFWTHIKGHAEVRNLPFEVTIEEGWKLFLGQERKCALSGLTLEMSSHKNNGKYFSLRTASFDRIDSMKGYTLDNCQWIHKDINKMKMNMNEKRFIEFCSLVSSNRGCK